MISALLTLLISGSAVASPLADSPQGFGVGVASGAITGLTAAYRPDATYTVGSTLGWNFTDTAMNLQADYQHTYHEFSIEKDAGVAVRTSVGLGAFGDFYDSYSQFGIHVPFGFVLIPGQRPFDVFTDLSPGVALYPTMFIPRGTVGARVYFR